MTDEESAKAELMAMTKEKLSLVEHDKYKIECCVVGCVKYWNLKDFGISPHYYIRGKFYDLTNNFSCERHFKMSNDLSVKPGCSLDRLIPCPKI